MPWKETRVVDQRLMFVSEYIKGERTVTDLCAAFGISRKTGHKIIRRFEEQGLDGLRDASRAPHKTPHAMSPEVTSLLVLARQAHPRWGPRKILAYLARHHHHVRLPVASTVGAFYKRLGLVTPRRRRDLVWPRANAPLAEARSPNDVWCADFKGWFRTADGYRCDPLTLSDAFSRYLLRSDIVKSPDFDGAQPIFESAFQEFGLPFVMRTDNGPPFATTLGIAGLSRLSIWWIKLGILPERIAPGHPEQNGRHERMHLTLKQEVASPPRATPSSQISALQSFRSEYNQERPHEALGQRTPAELYQPSPRQLPAQVPDQPQYPSHFVLRRVGKSGMIAWRGGHVTIGRVLTYEVVGLEQITDQYWRAHFGPVPLGLLDERTRRLTPFSNHAVEARTSASGPVHQPAQRRAEEKNMEP